MTLTNNQTSNQQDELISQMDIDQVNSRFLKSNYF